MVHNIHCSAQTINMSLDIGGFRGWIYNSKNVLSRFVSSMLSVVLSYSRFRCASRTSGVLDLFINCAE